MAFIHFGVAFALEDYPMVLYFWPSSHLDILVSFPTNFLFCYLAILFLVKLGQIT